MFVHALGKWLMSTLPEEVVAARTGLLQGRAVQAAGGGEQQQVSESWTLGAWRATVGLMEDEDEDVS